MTIETMKVLRFGMEIETVGITRDALARAIHSVVGGTVRGDQVQDARGRVWRAVPDGSLSSGFYSGEVVTPILEWGDIETLQQVIRALRAAGARADASCGIHIHVDGSRFDAKSLTNLVKLVNKQERLIEHALKIDPRRRQRYCRPIDQDFLARLERQPARALDEVKTAWYGRYVGRVDRYDQSRYHGLNLNSFFYRGTIEWRSFNSVLHAGKAKAYLHLVLAIAAMALEAKRAVSTKREFNPATARYDFRCFLLRLGFIGAEFKSTRKHLMEHLGGSAAWKGERRDTARRAAPGEAPAVDAGNAESEAA